MLFRSKLTLNAQVIRYGWDKFDAIRLGAPVNQAIPENYRTSWSYAGGVDYAASPTVNLRLEPPLIAAGSGQATSGGHCSAAK